MREPASGSYMSGVRVADSRLVTAPASSSMIYRNPAGGMSDIKAMPISWPVGTGYVGNGGLGAANSVYLQTAGTNSITAVPVAPPDSIAGVSYLSDIFKHFARAIFHKVGVRSRPIGRGANSTTALSVAMAPLRGYDLRPSWKSDTTAGMPTATIASMRGSQVFPTWTGCDLDLTPYITGGTGPSGREFNIGSTSSSTSESGGVNSLAIPCGFFVGGDASDATLQGANVTEFIADAVVSLVDFLGGFSEPNPEIELQWQCRRAREKVGRAHIEKCPTCTKQFLTPVKSSEAGPELAAPTAAELARLSLRRQAVVDDYYPVATPTPSPSVSTARAAPLARAL